MEGGAAEVDRMSVIGRESTTTDAVAVDEAEITAGAAGRGVGRRGEVGGENQFCNSVHINRAVSIC